MAKTLAEQLKHYFDTTPKDVLQKEFEEIHSKFNFGPDALEYFESVDKAKKEFSRNLKEFVTENLIKIGDLEYLDQNYISLYTETKFNRVFLAIWNEEFWDEESEDKKDWDERNESWILFRVSPEEIMSYINDPKTTLLDIYDRHKENEHFLKLTYSHKENKISSVEQIDYIDIPFYDGFISGMDRGFNKSTCFNLETIANYMNKLIKESGNDRRTE